MLDPFYKFIFGKVSQPLTQDENFFLFLQRNAEDLLRNLSSWQRFDITKGIRL